MELRKIDKKAQLSLGDAPTVVLLVGLVFLVMATIAFVGEKYGDSMVAQQETTATCNTTSGIYTGCGAAYNVTTDLQTEIGNNTSIAGIILTISLVGIVLTVLIGVFVGVRGGTQGDPSRP